MNYIEHDNQISSISNNYEWSVSKKICYILAVRNQGATKNVYQYIYTKGNYVIYKLPSSTFLRGAIIISAKWVLVTIGHSFASPWESIKYQAKLKEEALL